ncbi:MAG: ferritin-like domain-containing protein [Rhodospirillaceae bacterium]
MSRKNTTEMLQGSPRTVSEPDVDSRAFDELRQSYVQDAEAVGSVPPPATAKGVVQTGMQALTGNRAQVFIDKLSERLAFERTGSRLYDAMIVKCEAQADSIGPISVEQLKQIRDDELSHMHLVADAIQSLGADPTVQTPCADVAGVQGLGLVQALTDPRTDIAQSLNTILVAELADNASWELLSRLAVTLGKDDMARTFDAAYAKEQEHLMTIQQWLETLTLDLAKVDRGS